MWLHQETVKNSIYQFKYYNQRRYGIHYAEELVRTYAHMIKRWDPDLIIPIPIHNKRRKQRGYNQAALISKEIGKKLRIPVDEKSLFRRIYTAPQKKLDPRERKHNLKYAFALKQSFSTVPAVLLIDDIYTTGNTIDAVAKLLKKKGVEKVYFLTISIGQGF